MSLGRCGNGLGFPVWGIAGTLFRRDSQGHWQLQGEGVPFSPQLGGFVADVMHDGVFLLLALGSHHR